MKAHRPVRIAILECDTPADGTRAKYGSYGGVFKALLDAGLDALGKDYSNKNSSSSANEPETLPERLELSYWDVVNAQKYPAVEDVGGVLLTGSRTCLRAFDA